jgi:hypothetical protein
LKRVTLRGGVQIADPLAVALAFVEAYPGYDSHSSDPASFDESDLRHANRGGARISAAEKATILERRSRIERALRSIDPDASLAGRSIPWDALTRLFDAFGAIRGVGYSKMTKALHPKRPALIPMLDSVVQAYLAIDDPPDSFAEHATALVRAYKQDLDRNRAALRYVQRRLELTEVRILDILIWSAYASG